MDLIGIQSHCIDSNYVSISVVTPLIIAVYQNKQAN